MSCVFHVLFADNILTGSIPSDLARLSPHLIAIMLEHNFFSGNLPELSSLRSLAQLSVERNRKPNTPNTNSDVHITHMQLWTARFRLFATCPISPGFLCGKFVSLRAFTLLLVSLQGESLVRHHRRHNIRQSA